MNAILSWFRRVLGYEMAELRGYCEGYAEGVQDGWQSGWTAGNWHGYHEAQANVADWHAR